jgi:hypothetical protein
MASDMLILHLHLIQSVLSQKEEAKLRRSTLQERSQGRAVMRGHEVASLPSRMGLLMGRSRERVSPFRAKFGLTGQNQAGLVCANTVSTVPMAPVLHAITFCTWFVRFTDEVPRRLSRSGSVTASYKSHTKGLFHASEMGTGSPRPHPRGCQQRQSRGALSQFTDWGCSERQNLRVPHGPFRFMGPVSSAIKATKWPERTSSFQPAGWLRNRPQQPRLPLWQLVNVRRNQHGIVSHC